MLWCVLEGEKQPLAHVNTTPDLEKEQEKEICGFVTVTAQEIHKIQPHNV